MVNTGTRHLSQTQPLAAGKGSRRATTMNSRLLLASLFHIGKQFSALSESTCSMCDVFWTGRPGCTRFHCLMIMQPLASSRLFSPSIQAPGPLWRFRRPGTSSRLTCSPFLPLLQRWGNYSAALPGVGFVGSTRST